MGTRIRLEEIAYFNAEHPVNRLKSLMEGTGRWTGPAGYKGELVCEFSLVSPVRITRLDIGNHRSTSVQVSVGLKNWPQSKREPLVTHTFIDRHKMMGSDTSEFDKKLVTIKAEEFESTEAKYYDRIKLTVRQPLLGAGAKDVFGISLFDVTGVPKNGLTANQPSRLPDILTERVNEQELDGFMQKTLKMMKPATKKSRLDLALPKPSSPTSVSRSSSHTSVSGRKPGLATEESSLVKKRKASPMKPNSQSPPSSLKKAHSRSPKAIDRQLTKPSTANRPMATSTPKNRTLAGNASGSKTSSSILAGKSTGAVKRSKADKDDIGSSPPAAKRICQENSSATSVSGSAAPGPSSIRSISSGPITAAPGPSSSRPVYDRRLLPTFDKTALREVGILYQQYCYKKDKELPLKGNRSLKTKKNNKVDFYKVGPDIHLVYQDEFYLPDVQREHLTQLFKDHDPETVVRSELPDKAYSLLNNMTSNPLTSKPSFSSGSTISSLSPNRKSGKERKENMREKEEEKVVKRERVKEVKDERGECPLCSRRFEFSELEEHAATCQGRTEDEAGTCPLCQREVEPRLLPAHASSCQGDALEISSESSDAEEEEAADTPAYQECPMCERLLPASQIMEHASACQGIALNGGNGFHVNALDLQRKCDFCQQLIPEALMEEHVDNCHARGERRRIVPPIERKNQLKRRNDKFI